MDNFRFDVTGEGAEMLRQIFAIAFSRASCAVTHWRVAADKGLVLYDCRHTSVPEGVVPLPFKLDAAGAADFAARWLAEADYGREPDHDGSNGKGWRVYNEAWRRVGDDWRAFVAVQPVWAMYGK